MSKKYEKPKRKVKILNNPSLVKFLLDHMKPIQIDFSKIKFPKYMISN